MKPLEKLRRLSMLSWGTFPNENQRGVLNGLELAYYTLKGDAYVLEKHESTIPEYVRLFPWEIEGCEECDVTYLTGDGSAGELEDGRWVVWCHHWYIVIPCDEHRELAIETEREKWRIQ